MDDAKFEEIHKLHNIRIALNIFQPVFPFTYFRDKCDQKKQKLINSILDEIFNNTSSLHKYSSLEIKDSPSIGNTIWIFWYTGFDSAPPLIKKCAEIAKSLDDANVILIDKYNLEEYFVFEGNIKEYFEKGYISIQTFSDILRTQLLSRKGGFWFDATLFALRKNFISTHKDLTYFSIKHRSNDLLLKKKWNEFFTGCRWSTYCNGAGIGNPIFSFIYDMYIQYFNTYNRAFDYFQTDYIWLYAYEHFQWAKELIDATEPSVSCIYNFHHKLLKKFNQADWDKTLKENEFQKLGWRKVAPQKLKRKQHVKYEMYYDHFLDFSL